jgi:hypothetical protein
MAPKRVASNRIDTKFFPITTSAGTKLWVRVESDVVANVSGSSISAVANSTVQRVYYQPGPNPIPGAPGNLAATRSGNEPWKFENWGSGAGIDKAGKPILGADARQTLANRNSQASIALDNNAAYAISKRTISSDGVDYRLDSNKIKQGLGKAPTAKTPPAAGKPAGDGPAPTEENPGTDTTGDTGSEGSSEPQTLSAEQQEKLTNISAGPNLEYSEVLRYPLTSENLQGDYIKFQCWDYEKSGFNALESGVNDFKITRMRDRIKNPKGTVILPIQSGISDIKATSWADGEINPITAMFANIAYGTIGMAGDPGAAARNLFSGLGDAGKKLMANSDEMKQLVTNYFTEQALSGTLTNSLSRTSGAAINNNVELLFSGVALRSFTFNFKLTPRDKAEAERIRKIIRLFKREMTARLSTSGLFLLAPRVFTINYIYTGTNDNHPYLNKIGVCALRDFAVDYTPDGNYMTYADGGSMTQYNISMTFGEIDPIYASDYDETGDTQDNPTSMGY